MFFVVSVFINLRQFQAQKKVDDTLKAADEVSTLERNTHTMLDANYFLVFNSE